MSSKHTILVSTLAVAFLAPHALAQGGDRTSTHRSTPAPPSLAVYSAPNSPAFDSAIRRGTRTTRGLPGERYWQQRASYVLRATLDPAAKRVRGEGTVQYVNLSPDTLRELKVFLRQNMFAPGAARSDPGPVTNGMELSRAAVGGTALSTAADGNGPGYSVDGTVATIRLAQPLVPRDSVQLQFAWSYTPPPSPGDGRQGEDHGEVFMMGYWYPQMAVYDDVSGWETDPYTGAAEHYMDYGDYDVQLTVPVGWLVATTGELQNASDVLSDSMRARLARARSSGAIVRVRGADEPATAQRAGESSRTWHFSAHNVRDFAWAASDRFQWDATRAIVAGRDTVAIHCFYRLTPAAAGWKECASANRAAIEWLSSYLWPYPYPQMTGVEGVLTSGGMEYPMLTVIRSYDDSVRLARNLMHEIGHMWFPMQVGSDETRYPWQDEGLTEYVAARGYPLADSVGRGERSARHNYLELVHAGADVELMRHGNLFPSGTYFTIEYQKTTTVMAALRAILGEPTLRRALQTYGERWRGRHPQPYDFWHTVEDVSGRDLSWFWRAWFLEAWSLDQRVRVETSGSQSRITITNVGPALAPTTLLVKRSDGGTQRLSVPVDVWLRGAREHTLTVKSQPTIVSVQIDPDDQFPYVDRSVLTWQK